MDTFIYHHIPALGTTCEIWYASSKQDFELEYLFDSEILDFETKFSRFYGESLLSKFNKTPIGQKYNLEPEFGLLFGKTINWMKITEGVFNPFILPSLYEIGYSKSFVQNKFAENSLKVDGSDYPQSLYAINDYLEVGDDYLKKLKPIFLDFGGIGKGYLTDKLVEKIKNIYPEFSISLGGDLYVFSKLGIAIDISDEKNNVLKSINLINCAAATSSTSKRVFNDKNHIIDPRTKQPLTQTKHKQVTVIANLTEEADILAKTLLLDPEFKSELILDKYLF
ncbi:FAD:protein FMN transferase [Candidatus Dojkabacteria bacterium]|nr:FAD:protein FMN transferase [Candidatus Dojkabacteria bacterium]